MKLDLAASSMAETAFSNSLDFVRQRGEFLVFARVCICWV